MRLFKMRRFVHGSKMMLYIAALTFTLAGCERIFDGEGDCSTVYQVEFTYTMNIHEVDAFSTQVGSVWLFVFDGDGTLVKTVTESGEALAKEHYAMNIEGIEAGTYDLIAWGGLTDNKSFEFAGGGTPLTKTDLVCRLNREREGKDAYSQKPLDALFHGMADGVVFPEGSGVKRVARIDLTKDTNTVRIMLEQYSGKELNTDDFHFTVTDDNGTLNYDNSLLDDEYIFYREWTKRYVEVAAPDGAARASETKSLSAIVAEIDVARLMVDKKPILKIEVDGKDEPVLQLPLIDLLLIAKGEARRSMSAQEYVDRQDEYNIVFFIDDAYGWYIKGGIIVNGWHVIYQEEDM